MAAEEDTTVLLKKKTWHIVRKTTTTPTDSQGPRHKREQLERNLEEALEKRYDIIVIEPRSLGDDVVRWIKTGNFLHKAAVLSNLGMLILAPLMPRHLTLYVLTPLGSFGVGCALLYNISWQFDPCCKYQVDWSGEAIQSVPSDEIGTTTPIILVQRNDIYRKILHTSLAVIVVGYLSWKWYSRH